MLPTPAKTPRKRALQTDESLGATARVLFADRPATIEAAVPTPRKARKTIKNAISLESFAHQMDNDPGESIEIYTDSKDRIPTADEDEENPFNVKKGKGKAKARSAAATKTRKMTAAEVKMDEAVRNDAGMVYLQ